MQLTTRSAALLLAALTVGCFSPNSAALLEDDGDDGGTETSSGTEGASSETLTTTNPTPTGSSSLTGSSETDPPQETDTQDDTESDSLTETASESESASETASESESESESESDTESASESDTETESDTEVGPLCGNAEVEDDEDCDDGNEIDGDGCNVDCIESGSLLWSSTYDEQPTSAIALAVSAEDEVMVVGRTDNASNNYGDWRRLYSADGDAISTGNTSGFDVARITAQGSEYGIVFVDSAGEGVPGDLVGIALVDGLFDEEWTAALPNRREVGELHAWTNGGLVLAGGVHNSGFAYQYEHDGFVTAFNNGGNEAWTRGIADNGAPADCHPSAATEDGDVLVACVQNIGGPNLEVLARRYSENGSLTWEESLGEVEEANIWTNYFAFERHFPSMAVADDDTVALVIYDRIFKLDANGLEEWSHNEAVAGGERFDSIAIDGQGDIIVAGRRTSGTGDGTDGVIMKFASDGELRWTVEVDGLDGADDEIVEIELDSNDNIAAVGTLNADGDDEELWVAKLAP